jgi:hypothetical protein
MTILQAAVVLARSVRWLRGFQRNARSQRNPLVLLSE